MSTAKFNRFFHLVEGIVTPGPYHVSVKKTETADLLKSPPFEYTRFGI